MFALRHIDTAAGLTPHNFATFVVPPQMLIISEFVMI